MTDKIIADSLKYITDEFKDLVKKLIEVINQSSVHFDSAIKWKQLTFTKKMNFHHWIIAISQTKKYIGLNFHFGGLLNNYENRFSKGTSKFLRKIEINHAYDIDNELFMDLVNQAIDKRDYFIDNWMELNSK